MLKSLRPKDSNFGAEGISRGVFYPEYQTGKSIITPDEFIRSAQKLLEEFDEIISKYGALS